MGVEIFNGVSNLNPLQLLLDFDQWMPLPVHGFHPLARCKHAAEVVNGKLYISGGSRNGRSLSDVQVLDLLNMKWTSVNCHLHHEPAEEKEKILEGLPALSGHSMVKWGNKLLIVGGYSKGVSDSMTVWSIDTETDYFSNVKTSGKVPITRGGHSVTLVGSKLIVFGGEDIRKRPLNDLHILDLEDWTWNSVETMQNPPQPRFDHTATVHDEQYLLIFGGGSHSTCFGDLHILDLHAMEWSQPQMLGEEVTPRAGHACATIDENWYIIGGGDNTSGSTETLVLNMSTLVWSVVTHVKERDPLACEGLSLCSTSVNGENILIAFGGYNGKYNSEVFVLKPKPSGSSRSRIYQSPAAAAAAASVAAAYALTTSDKPNLENPNILQSEKFGQTVSVPTDSIATETSMIRSKLEEVRLHNSSLEVDLSEMNHSQIELSKELHSVRNQLEAEKSRCSKLEMQIAELQRKLESYEFIEERLQLLRIQKSASEKNLEKAEKESSSGVWKWITS